VTGGEDGRRLVRADQFEAEDLHTLASDVDPPTVADAQVLGSGLTGAWVAEVGAEADSDSLWWSPEMYEIFGVQPTGYSPSFEGVFDAMEPGSLELIKSLVDSWRATPEPFAETFRIQRPGGEKRLIEVSGWTDLDQERRPRGLMGTCRDVTLPVVIARDRSRLSRQRAMILRAAGDGICGLDPHGLMTFSNPALNRLLHREGESLEGRRLHDLVHRDRGGRELHNGADCPFENLDARPASATDADFHRADGARIEVAYVLVAIDDDDFPGAVVSFRDITARRAAARLLQTSLQQVQTLSAQRGALLKHLAEAEERERLRIAADIHDDTIQALGAVALRLSRAGEHAANDPDRDLLADAEIEVRGVADRLRRLMFELMPPVAGNDLRSAVETYCSVLFAGSEMRYEIVGDIGGLGSDRYLLAYRLIQEALRNALTHSEAARVRVEFDRTPTELVFRVSDDGVGMGDGETPPTHAGLRIVRRRAEAASGSAQFGIGLDGRGSSIELRLPLVWSDTP
jgi:PAS domain S-box-containing protein